MKWQVSGESWNGPWTLEKMLMCPWWSFASCQKRWDVNFSVGDEKSRYLIQNTYLRLIILHAGVLGTASQRDNTYEPAYLAHISMHLTSLV